MIHLSCDSGRLSAGEGLLLLVTRMMDRLEPGQVLEVRSSDPAGEAGGLNPERLPAGMRARAELYSTMHANRIRRLIAIGFAEAAATELSGLPTPNFM